MPLFTDQLRRQIFLKDFPRRIISLVPSITELLFDLNLDNEVVGITKFCVHPEIWFRSKTKVGGTKNIKADIIKALNPQLIIANKEENVKEQVEALENICPVFITDVDDLNSALEMIDMVGAITNRNNPAQSIIQKIKNEFTQFKPSKKKLRVCYLIWRNPYMTIGGDTFINNMLEYCGFENVFADYKRYPEITIDQLSTVNCQLILLSSEPFPFKEKHVYELLPLLPLTKIILVDGEMFSWYGSRLQFAPDYFLKLVNELNKEDEKL